MKQFEKLRDKILEAARRQLEHLSVEEEAINDEVAVLRPKLNDLNRRTLKDKIHLLAKRWGVPLDGISDEALGKAKQAREHIVHRGQYKPKDPSEDLMGHVRLTRELVVRFSSSVPASVHGASITKWSFADSGRDGSRFLAIVRPATS